MTVSMFVTGATGCIGHYVIEQLHCTFPNAQLHLLARNPEKFRFDVSSWNHVTIHPYCLDGIHRIKDVLAEVDYLIHIATVWGYNLEENIRLNRDVTLQMFDYLNPNRCKKILYFSTASILKPKNQLSQDAYDSGIPYVQSKYAAYIAIQQSKWRDRIVTLFPTIVLGGGERYPYSHIASGLKQIRQYRRWIQWVRLTGVFHVMHAKDIAQMTVALLNYDTKETDIVLGLPEITFNKALTDVRKHLQLSTVIGIPISKFVILLIIWIFRLNVDQWAKYCIRHPYFNHDTMMPSDIGLTAGYPTFQSMLSDL